MLNIFNLSLFLFAIWTTLCFFSKNFLIIYLILGLIASIAISLFSYRLKIIEEKSELLYLSLGFYSHFFLTYFSNFLNSLRIIFAIAVTNKDLNIELHEISLNYKNKFNPTLLIATINMTGGLFCTALKEDAFVIHCLDGKFLKKLDFATITHKLKEINDDNIV